MVYVQIEHCLTDPQTHVLVHGQPVLSTPLWKHSTTHSIIYVFSIMDTLTHTHLCKSCTSSNSHTRTHTQSLYSIIHTFPLSHTDTPPLSSSHTQIHADRYSTLHTQRVTRTEQAAVVKKKLTQLFLWKTDTPTPAVNTS